MFNVNDVVVYGSQGICRIVGVEEQKTGEERKVFFILKPEKDRSATFYVPTWNQKALSKLRKVMTMQDVNSLIDSMPDSKPTWIDNEKARRETYKKILATGDPAAVISMVQALFVYKKQREAEGKRLHMADEQFLKDAEQLLYNEWQYVLNMSKDELMVYIFRRIEGI